MSARNFDNLPRELFDRIMQMTDKAGASDEHRVLNCLTVRYPAIYAKAAEVFARDFSLAGVETRPSPREERTVPLPVRAAVGHVRALDRYKLAVPFLPTESDRR